MPGAERIGGEKGTRRSNLIKEQTPPLLLPKILLGMSYHSNIVQGGIRQEVSSLGLKKGMEASGAFKRALYLVTQESEAAHLEFR